MYDEPMFDDAHCIVCGKELTPYPEEGTPDFEGFCCKECQDKWEKEN